MAISIKNEQRRGPWPCKSSTSAASSMVTFAPYYVHRNVHIYERHLTRQIFAVRPTFMNDASRVGTAPLSWGRQDAPTWLALHGWLDNAASFTRLAPRLVSALGIRIVAIDFRGHGHSAHAPAGNDYALWDYTHDVLDAMEALGLEQATLLAHSMGAAVSCLLAAALPEKVARLIPARLVTRILRAPWRRVWRGASRH